MWVPGRTAQPTPEDSDPPEASNAHSPADTRSAGEHLSDSYGDDMEILYIAASGSSDATRASIPWHLAVNGSFEAGQSTGVLLLGDAAEVLVPHVRDAIEGVGIAPLRELLSKARDISLPVFV
jgi:hypothetical protein